jgi:cytochrome c biogenesis protein CcdA
MELSVALASAFWLGLVTAVNPCPLTLNLAAISYLGRRAERPSRVLAGGMLYVAGQLLAYVGLAFLLAGSVLADHRAAAWLQEHLHRYVGPVLILAGVFMLGLIEPPAGGGRWSAWLGKRAETFGLAGAALLGFVFALSFCPTTAVAFFGALMVLVLQSSSAALVPAAFALGGALPVLLLATLLAVAGRKVAAAYGKLTEFFRWARWFTGGLMTAVGLFLCLRYIW